MPVSTTVEDTYEVVVFAPDDHAPDPLGEWRDRFGTPRIFPAIIRTRLGTLPVLAVWPSDIPPPDLAQESFGESVRRDAVQFVRPGHAICKNCGQPVEGLEALRYWLGGNRRRHKFRRCPHCDADSTHMGVAFLKR